jgi:hypothetical protein
MEHNSAFNKSCQALGFWVSLGGKIYEGHEVVFNDWMLGETKPLKQRERDPRHKENANETATNIIFVDRAI